LFACLVALGSGDVTRALILLVVILVVQNVVQTIVATKLQSEKLRLHPIAGLVSTIVGAALAGLLGATLSAPVLASIIRVNRRLRDRNTSVAEPAGLEHPTADGG
jgi:predicted PurR-regulated permease PerM